MDSKAWTRDAEKWERLSKADLSWVGNQWGKGLDGGLVKGSWIL